uniref:Uncharacterized protein n=1 Tax=Plectus sambesii TaxID=2011161 RepID=A0A914WM86_9BILA
TELEAFVAGDSTEANIIGTAAEECAHREQLMNATNDRIKEALDKENRAMAVMQRAEKEIRSILGVVDRPPRPTVTLHQPTTSVAASSSSSNSHNHSHSHGHSHSHSHSHSNHNSNSNSNRTTRMSMNDRFLRLVGVRPSEASSSSYVPTVRPAPSSSSSPSPTRQLTSPVLPQNNRQRSTIRLSLNPVRVIPTPHTSDFSSRSPSPVHLTYRLATPSPIAIDDDSDAADAIRSASVDRDEDDAASNSFISQAPSSVRSPMRVAFDDVSSDSDDTVDLAVTRQQQAEETSSSGQRREQQRKRPRRITVDHHRHQSSSSPFFPADMPSTSQRHRAQPSSRVSRPRRVTSPIASIRYRRGQFAVSSDSD